MPHVSAITHAEHIRDALKLAPQGHRDLPAALADALHVVHAVESARTEATAAAVIGDVIATATAADVEDRLDGAARRWMRSAAVQGAQAALDRSFTTRLTAALNIAVPEAVTRLVPVFDDTAATLTTAAHALPAGTAPLDPAAVLASDAGPAFNTANGAVQTLLRICAVHDPVTADPSRGVPAGVSVLPAVTITGKVERLTYTTEASARTHPTNDPAVVARVHHVRALLTDAAADPVVALVRAARGDYGKDVRLALAADSAEVNRRREAVRDAHMVRNLKGNAVA